MVFLVYRKTPIFLIRPFHTHGSSYPSEALYNALFTPEESEPFPREIIQLPQLRRYISDFGKEGDICFIAEFDGNPVGAIWVRLFSEDEKGYGFVDNETPDLSMSVSKEFQNKGIGTTLLKHMLNVLENSSFKQVSLSVDIRNYAHSLYKKHGFVTFSQKENSVIMLRNL